MAPTRKPEITALVLRVALGAWFAYAGGLKIFVTGLDRFVTDIENYRMVFAGVAIMGNLAVAVAYFIPWFEVVVGLCFMLGYLRKGAWLGMFGLVMAFSVSIGSAWWRGLDISCGCTGSTEKVSYWRKALEFAIYFAALGWIAWVEWRIQPRMNANERE
jgi:uncharacterized membrane protein YphA (DoxX/SURF4 family)